MTEVSDAQQAACLARVNTYLQSIEGSSAEAEASALAERAASQQLSSGAGQDGWF